MPDPALLIEPLTGRPDVEIRVPGSKSHTNRALVCAGVASGRSTLRGVLDSDDTEAMLLALAALGVGVEPKSSTDTFVITGPPARAPDGPRTIDVRQSGTTGRFLLPVLAATPGRFVLDGDPQMRGRPFGPQLEALVGLGAEVRGDRLPLEIEGRRLRGGSVRISGSMSSQFLSGLLLAAPLIEGRTVIQVVDGLVSTPYVELTLATMARFGVVVRVGEVDGLTGYTVDPGERGYRPTDITIEPDASAASYFFGAAAITGGRVRIPGLGADTVQGDLGFVRVLESMGATVRQSPDWTEVEGPERLRGVTVDMSDISDTAQTLAVVATFADSPTEVTGIGFIARKETDRHAAVAAELSKLGIEVTVTDDGWIIHPGVPRPGTVDTYRDHRMAMSFALLGLRHPGIEIADPECVAKTFPRFFAVLDRLRR